VDSRSGVVLCISGKLKPQFSVHQQTKPTTAHIKKKNNSRKTTNIAISISMTKCWNMPNKMRNKQRSDVSSVTQTTSLELGVLNRKKQ
jgi:hypothetical protein